MARLIIRSGAAQGHALQLSPGVTSLGRDPGNHYHFDDPTMSGRHCELEISNNGIKLRDLASTNGTLVGGRRVGEAALDYGQTFQIGAVELELAPDPEIAIPHVEFAEPVAPTQTAEGQALCINHSNHLARYFCPACGKQFCPQCLHTVRRVGGHLLLLCPICSGKCQLLPGQLVSAEPHSFFARLGQRLLKRTIRWRNRSGRRPRRK